MTSRYTHPAHPLLATSRSNHPPAEAIHQAFWALDSGTMSAAVVRDYTDDAIREQRLLELLRYLVLFDQGTGRRALLDYLVAAIDDGRLAIVSSKEQGQPGRDALGSHRGIR